MKPISGELVGRTMFDLPGSADMTVTILLSQDKLQTASSQALLRIISNDDQRRRYLAVVTAGPFAEPDGLRGDSPLLIAVATQGAPYMPPYHGRVEAQILGEELEGGVLAPPRLRPLPNSEVYAVPDNEAGEVLKVAGDIRLGLAVGLKNVTVNIPSQAKSVLPRHTAILGTTGGGKSTTVAGLIQQAQAANMAVIVLDVEGEYTRLNEPTGDPKMRQGLTERGLDAKGLPTNAMTVYHLTGRETANPDHPNVRPFSVQFARTSPYTACEIMNLSEAQQERFFKAYDIAKELLRELNLFPVKGNREHEQFAMDVDEFQRGYPRVTIPMLLDIAVACAEKAEGGSSTEGGTRSGKKTTKAEEICDEVEEAPKFRLNSKELNTPEGMQALKRKVNAGKFSSAISWRALMGRLGRLNRLKVFYEEGCEPRPLNYARLLKPGTVSIIDLSDSGFSDLNNLVISDLLFGLQEAQDDAYVKFEKEGGEQPPRAMIIIEEAHEFLSEERISKTPILFDQVSRLARRGRKRWLSLAFVTQLPQHLPRQLLGLVNGFILHKITDAQIIASLRKSIPGIDEGLWNRLASLTPGQAIVSFPHLTKPLLTSIDPTAAQLRMVE